MFSFRFSIWILLCCLFIGQVFSASVPVHDPSVIVVYKDGQGNSFPKNDPEQTRTKYYYIFGTMLGAAYSKDMINWTSFTPSFSKNGIETSDYYALVKTEADYAGHTTSEDVKGNLWAPDIVYNQALQKWTYYISLSGKEFKSSIILFTADQIEGPYDYKGVVVYGGFTNKESSVGRDDYAKVMGSESIDGRYLNADGTWNNDYGVSNIDPAVTYDEQGNLWMVYGSWSGGIYLLRLNPSTGFRDSSYKSEKGNTPVWEGSRLRYDPYFGQHIGGGYYVSGEGPYLEYFENAAGEGHYYLFVSMGFYSPEGGYTMRVFRSKTIDGIYTDLSGDDAVFTSWVFNYGNNVQYGFPIMQNYRWDWWDLGEIAQGHNSALRDEDGKMYLIYHRKMDNGTAWHNVEVHELFFNEDGWPLAAPFEYRVGFGKENKVYSREDIVGEYGVISHHPVDYENLASNRETRLFLHGDGRVTGSYTGTWNYTGNAELQWLTIETSAGTFRGVLTEGLMNDLSVHTLTFTGVEKNQELALWAYRIPKTSHIQQTQFLGASNLVGASDYSMVWYDYNQFYSKSVSGDFFVEFEFINHTEGMENWHNWALAFVNGEENWYVRGDAFSNTTFSGSEVGFHVVQGNFTQVYKNQRVRVRAEKRGGQIEVFAFVEGLLVFSATATGVPEGEYSVLLGGENCYLDVKKERVGVLEARKTVGSVGDDGTYGMAFLGDKLDLGNYGGDFETRFHFYNYHHPESVENWDNYVLSVSDGNGEMLLRADSYAMNPWQTAQFSWDWNWENFQQMMAGAFIQMTVKRQGSELTVSSQRSSREGDVYKASAVFGGVPLGNLKLALSGEESMGDLYLQETVAIKGVDEIVPFENVPFLEKPVLRVKENSLWIEAKDTGILDLRDAKGALEYRLKYQKGQNHIEGLRPGIYFGDKQKITLP